MKNTIFTNVAHNLDDNTVWWEGLDKNPPENALDWTGMNPGTAKRCRRRQKGAHPNSRFTAPASELPVPVEQSLTTPMACPISAMVFGGRRAKTAPAGVSRRFDWNHGVYRGLASWLLRPRLPLPALWALCAATRWPCCPFCGYNMGDYFAALD